MRDLEKASPRPELRARIMASLPYDPPVREAPTRHVRAMPRYAFGALAAAGVAAIALGRLPAPVREHPAGPARSESPRMVVMARTDRAPAATFSPAAHRRGVEAILSHGSDDVNRRADELFLARSRAEAEAQNHPAAAAQPAVNNTVSGTVRLALLVNDTELGSASATAAALASGGTVTRAPAEARVRRGDTALTASVVRLRIPSTSMPEFLGRLREAGDVRRVTVEPRPAGGGRAQPAVADAVAQDDISTIKGVVLKHPSKIPGGPIKEPVYSTIELTVLSR